MSFSEEIRSEKYKLTPSHSADFMDEVCTNMVELTLDKGLAFYGGNFSSKYAFARDLFIHDTDVRPVHFSLCPNEERKRDKSDEGLRQAAGG